VLLDAAETKSRDESAAFETGDAFEKCSKDACSFRVPERSIHVEWHLTVIFEYFLK
jgi:hypothetical protein